MTYKLAWVQPNFQQGPKELNAHYLPYSAGVIWSYAIADPWVRDNFEVTEWVWRRDAVEPLAQRLAQNDIVTFSTYVWNHRYNYEIARRVKEINPAVLTIFGGPEPAITDPELFVKEPFIDIVICFDSDEAGRKANAHNLLLWRGIDYLKKLGIERLDLGGVNTRVHPGISRFKLGTGGRPLTLAGTYF